MLKAALSLFTVRRTPFRLWEERGEEIFAGARSAIDHDFWRCKKKWLRK
jgi:hypothetical protein